MYILSTIFSLLFWPIVIIGVIVFFVRRKNRDKHTSSNKEEYLQIALSKEDLVSQFFLLLSVLFFGVTLLAFNRDFGSPISWQTILFITSVFALVGAYYMKAFYLLVGLIGITTWWSAQSVVWIEGKDINSTFIFAGIVFIALLLYLIGRLHERKIKWKRFTSIYFVIGITITTGVLFLFSTKSGLSILGTATKGSSFFSVWQIALSWLLILVSLIGTALYATVKKFISYTELITVFILALLFFVIALLPQQTMFIQAQTGNYFYYGNAQLSSFGILWAIVFNVSIFFELLGIIFLGYFRKETKLINLGVILLFLLIIIKYFTWLFNSIDKSIFFIGAGVLLFVVGFFMEKGRRLMLLNIAEQEKQI